MEEYTLEYKALPKGIDGVTFRAPGGQLIMWIDESLPAHRKHETIIHEECHIKLGHFDKQCKLSVDECEWQAIELAESILAAE